jgi:purine-binding chemotaxis protein CheW
MNPTTPTAPLDVLLFEVAGRRFALPLADVREVVRAASPLPLPSSPPAVEGAVNLRGTVLPVVDLRRRFGLPPRPVEPADHLVIARASGRWVALRVDRALDLVRLDPADVEELPPLAPGGRSARLARLPDGLVLLPDPADLLSPAESAALGDGQAPRPQPEGGAP